MSHLLTKLTKRHVRPAKSQIRPGWSEPSLSTWRKLGSLATHWVHSEDSDQTLYMPRLNWVFAGRTVILLVLSLGGSIISGCDQDGLPVKRRNDNHSPGPVIMELVPSSHQRSELRDTILCIFSRCDQRIGECIPILDSLGEDTTFKNICISIWSP